MMVVMMLRLDVTSHGLLPHRLHSIILEAQIHVQFLMRPWPLETRRLLLTRRAVGQMLRCRELRRSPKMGHGIAEQHGLVVMLRLLPTEVVQRIMALSASVLELLMMLRLVDVLMLCLLVRI